MFAPEKFTPRTSRHPETGKPLQDDLEAQEGRRGVLFRFLADAAKRPETLRDGLDIDKLNSLIDVEFRPHKPGGQSAEDRFMARFHPGIKYAPLSAIESAPDEALSPEMRELRDFMPFLRGKLREKALAADFEPKLPPGEAVVIGFGKKDPEAELHGGYHASLNEQGYKIFDALLQENLRLDGAERPEYRALDVLRSVAHDFTHSTQFKLFGRASADPERGYPGPEDISIKRYGLAMLGRDHAVEIDGEKRETSLGAALFEYATDDLAREIVREYLEERGGLPEPESKLEELMLKDFRGEAISPEDAAGLPETEKETGEFMVKYGKDIVRPAEEVLRLMGPLRERMLAAMREASFTGKFTRVRDMRAWLDELPPENVAKLKEYALEGAIFLRPLFEGKELGKRGRAGSRGGSGQA